MSSSTRPFRRIAETPDHNNGSVDVHWRQVMVGDGALGGRLSFADSEGEAIYQKLDGVGLKFFDGADVLLATLTYAGVFTALSLGNASTAPTPAKVVLRDINGDLHGRQGTFMHDNGNRATGGVRILSDTAHAVGDMRGTFAITSQIFTHDYPQLDCYLPYIEAFNGPWTGSLWAMKLEYGWIQSIEYYSLYQWDSPFINVSSVSTVNNTVTLAATNISFVDGTRVKFGPNPPSPLVVDTPYHVRESTDTPLPVYSSHTPTFKLSVTRDGPIIVLTSVGVAPTLQLSTGQRRPEYHVVNMAEGGGASLYSHKHRWAIFPFNYDTADADPSVAIFDLNYGEDEAFLRLPIEMTRGWSSGVTGATPEGNLTLVRICSSGTVSNTTGFAGVDRLLEVYTPDGLTKLGMLPLLPPSFSLYDLDPVIIYDMGDPGTLFKDLEGTDPALEDDDAVALVKDKSGNLIHIKQPTLAFRPLRKTDGDGKVYLHFDGVDDFMYNEDNITDLIGTELEIVAVLKVTDATPLGIHSLWGFNENIALDSGVYPYLDGNIYEGFGSNDRKPPFTPLIDIAVKHIYGVSAGTTWAAYQNDPDTPVATDASNTFQFRTWIVGAGVTFQIGLHIGSGFYFAGDIYDIALLAGRLTDAERTLAYAHLDTKEAIP